MRPSVKLVQKLLSRSIERVFLFWRGGIWTYVGITLFILQPHYADILAAVDAGSWIPLFKEIGSTIGTAWFSVLTGVEALPSASGFGYLTTLWYEVVVPLVTIFWYFRTTHLAAKLIEPDVSPLIPLMFSVPLFVALVWATTGRAPIPETLEAAQQVDDVVGWRELVNMTATE